MSREENPLKIDDSAKHFEKMNPLQEDPKLIEMLKRNAGDFSAVALELANDFDNEESRILLARLIQKRKEQDRIIH